MFKDKKKVREKIKSFSQGFVGALDKSTQYAAKVERNIERQKKAGGFPAGFEIANIDPTGQGMIKQKMSMRKPKKKKKRRR